MPKHPDLDKKISVLIPSQLPDFIKNDYPLFMQFMRAYYEFLEQQKKPYELISNLKYYTDIDRTIQDFVKYFKRNFLHQIPDSMLANKEFVVKKIREFYRERGSEESFKLLFKLIFNDDNVSFKYPGEDILKVSDGRWVREQFIRVFFDSNSFAISGRRVQGQTSKATAIIEAVIKFNLGSEIIAECILSNTEGIFISGEDIKTIDDNPEITQTIAGVVVSITIDTPGKNYQIGDVVTVNDPNVDANVSEINTGGISDFTINSGGSGYQVGDYLFVDNTGVLDVTGKSAVVRVTQVSSGAITDIKIEDSGRGYKDLPVLDGSTINGIGTGADIDLTSDDIGGIKSINISQNGFNVTSPPAVSFGSASGTGAAATAILGGQFSINNGRWLGTNGQLSSDKVIQDSFFYQDYSYVIRAGVSIDIWRDVISKVLHPAGMLLFGEVSIEEVLNVEISATGELSSGEDLYYQTIVFPLASPDDPQYHADISISEVHILDFIIANQTGKIFGFGTDTFDLFKMKLQGGLNEQINPGAVTSARITNGGSGYTVAPTVSVDNTGTNGSGFSATVTVSGGEVDSITIDNPGSGYTIPPILTLTGGDGTGASARAGVPAHGVGYGVYNDFGDLTLEDFYRSRTPDLIYTENKIRFQLEPFIQLERE